jgi:hypothetical protein
VLPNSLNENEIIPQRIEIHSTNPIARKEHTIHHISSLEAQTYWYYFQKLQVSTFYSGTSDIEISPCKTDTIARANVRFKLEFTDLKNGLNSPCTFNYILPMSGNKTLVFHRRMEKKMPTKYRKLPEMLYFP